MRLIARVCMAIGYVGLIVSIGLSISLGLFAAFVGLFGGYSIQEISKGNPEWTQNMVACLLAIVISIVLITLGRQLSKRRDVGKP
jgi:uncharacterized membrane protein